MKLEFSRQIYQQILKYYIPRKSVQWEPSCSMWTDRHTDLTKLIVIVHSFANSLKNADSCYAVQCVT